MTGPTPPARRPAIWALLRRDWTATVAIVLILASHATLPRVRNKNFRTTTESSWNLARIARGVQPAGPILSPADDQGPTLLMAATTLLAYSREDLARLPAMPRIPRLYFVLLVAANAVMLGLLYFAARRLWGRGVAIGLIAIYTLGSNVRFLAFSGDVYMFPWYAGILMLGSFALLDSRVRGATVGLGACVLGMVICSVFRSGSSLVGVGFLLAAARPQWIARHTPAGQVRRRAIAAGLLLLALSVARSAVLPERHTMWHALHAGLLEFGGHRDAAGRVYPYFIADVPAGAEFVPRWGDGMVYDLAGRTRPGVVKFSPEYDAIVREDVLRVVTRYPAGMIRLIGRRLWRLLILNPWQPCNPVSELIPHWSDTPVRIAWLTLVAIALRRLGPRTLVTVAALAPLALPALLVHSAYLMYNFPVHLMFYLLVACSIAALMRRRDIGGAAAA